MGTWMRLSDGREELIPNPDHVKRLIEAGGVEIVDPTSVQFELIPTVFEPAIIAPIETEFEPPVTTELAVTEDQPTIRKRGRQAKQ